MDSSKHQELGRAELTTTSANNYSRGVRVSQHSTSRHKVTPKPSFVSLYVDDLIYMVNNKEMIHEFKEDIMNTFEMIDLG